MHTAFPIRNDEDLSRAIALIDALWSAEPGSPEADLLEVMSTLVDRYEAEQSELPAADPIELIRFKLGELGWSQRELGRRLGWSSGRVSEVLGRKRPLTLAMVQSLSRVLGLPAGLLVHDHACAEDDPHAVALPPSLAREIRAQAERRGLSVEVAVADALSWAFHGAAVTTSAEEPTPANREPSPANEFSRRALQA